jgi:sugar phosphate isomerase/epimerase
MSVHDIPSRLAVCSWSLQPKSPAELVAKLNEIGIRRVQLSIDPLREGGAWSETAKALAEAGVRVVSAMFMTVGEDYSTMEAIRRTGGVVPDATWDATWSNVQQMVPIARKLGVGLVTMHAGFLPHDPGDPTYGKLSGRLGQIADLCAAAGLKLGLETGQEDADTLVSFLRRLNRPNVGVNFDPANMILYDKGDPIEALRKLSKYVLQCHIKDATRTAVPGEWGAEVAVGTGEVDWPAFFDVLKRIDFTGDLAIEREAGEQRVADIITAKQHVTAIAGR